MNLRDLHDALNILPHTERMPTLFIGHGSPMNALEENQFTHKWREIGSSLPKARAILVISAHWLTKGTLIHASTQPKMIYDFFGFPPELYHLNYPCKGSPEFAYGTGAILDGEATLDYTWGIDHGAWVPLMRLFPDAAIPVYQLSIDITKSPQQHFELGRSLSELRERGVMIVASGNIVHNLRMIDWEHPDNGFDWAHEFDALVTNIIDSNDYARLLEYEKLGNSAELAVPTNDHYLPLIYALAAHKPDEEISYPVSGLIMGSLSMRSIRIG